ncbi:MAG: long-chain fatty acid--CoA ligase [Solibacillus sp.]
MKRPWQVNYPESIPIELNIPSCSIYHFLERATQDFPNNLAIIDQGEEVTYTELNRKVDKFAAALHHRGFKKGDRVGVMLFNCKEYIIAYFGILRLGGIVVQLNPMYQQHELTIILRDAEPKWLICEYNQISKLEDIGYSSKLSIITSDINSTEYLSLYDLIEEENSELPVIQINSREDLAALCYTGGTTGIPKGVMSTHFNIVASFFHTCVTDQGVLERSNERYLGVFPMFHGAGMQMLINAIYHAAIYIPIKHFRVEDALPTIRKYRPTYLSIPPSAYIALLNHPDFKDDDLSSLKVCRSGSAPIPLEVQEAFEQKTGIRICEAYGLTESNSVAVRTFMKGNRKLGSVGLPVPNMDLKIVDVETGEEEMPVGESGEILLKSPQNMKGYWKNPEETARTIRDGWLHTGDIGVVDEDGFLYIVGRKKEMIIAGGYNIYPKEIDEVLYAHPAIAEVCVFGIPDVYRGETVRAAVVLKENHTLTEEEIINWCRERLAKYKVPRQVEFREQLPKTTVGKILRRTLLEEYNQQLKKV